MTVIDPVEEAVQLVRIASVNPELAESDGEGTLADYVAERLKGFGLVIEEQHVTAGRSNILATLEGNRPGTVVLEAHLDTVPMPAEPMPVGIVNNRLWGRGSCDTKASLASMITAIQILSQSHGDHPTVIFAGAIDEEYVMKGARALADLLSSASGIIIGEPTELRVVRAHNGCVRFDIEIHGRTAHSSRATLGRNAIIDASRLIAFIQDELGNKLESRPHPLTGVGLLTPTVIEGGIAPNVVPDACTVRFDRRMVPGESIDAVLAEIDEVLDKAASVLKLSFTRSEPWLELPAMEVPENDPLVQASLSSCRHELGVDQPAGGVPYCTDANILTGFAGIPSIVLGPGSIDQAHAPEEWVDIDQIRHAASIYVSAVQRLGTLGASNAI